MVKFHYPNKANSNGTEPEIEFLYKYRELNENTEQHIERIFTHSELYFASPRQFNDPFDSKVQLSFHGTKQEWQQYLLELYKEFQPHLNREQRFAKVKMLMKKKRYKRLPKNMANSYLDEIGVFSMSEKNDHILMWSHYSENHTGFCLEFRATSDTPFFGQAQKVKYAESYPKVNFFKSSNEEKMKTVLLTKAKFWEYEQEWRIIDHETGSGIYTFPSELLTGVIIGCQMAEENKKKIETWVNNRDPQPTLYLAELKEGEFGLDIIPISLN
jgi:hypothetical protein